MNSKQAIPTASIATESDRVFSSSRVRIGGFIAALNAGPPGRSLWIEGHQISECRRRAGGIDSKKGSGGPSPSQTFTDRGFRVSGLESVERIRGSTRKVALNSGVKREGSVGNYILRGKLIEAPATETALNLCASTKSSRHEGGRNDSPVVNIAEWNIDTGRRQSVGFSLDSVKDVYRNRNKGRAGHYKQVRSASSKSPIIEGARLLEERLCTSYPGREQFSLFPPSQLRRTKERLPFSREAVSDTELQARQIVGGKGSWLKVVEPFRNVKTSEEEWPALSGLSSAGKELEKALKDVGITRMEERKSQSILDSGQWPSLSEARPNEGFQGNLESFSYREDSYRVAGLGERKIWQPVSMPKRKGGVSDAGLGRRVSFKGEVEEERVFGVRESLLKESKVVHRDSSKGVCDGRREGWRREGEHQTGGGLVPPLLLMLNKDFIVTSPLKQNLLLTIALTERKDVVEAIAGGGGEVTVRNRERERRQILVGQFTAFSSFLHFGLGRDATRVRTESNAGGTSTISESLSVEYFVRRFQAKDIVTEMEVEYCALNWKKVDYICTLYDQRVGVSVTRAMSFPDPKDFSAQMAYRLLYKKLFGLVVARHGVTKRHSFSQCILHVWCETQDTARILEQQYEGVSEELDITDDVIMVLTVAEGWHARPIFYESILKRVAA